MTRLNTIERFKSKINKDCKIMNFSSAKSHLLDQPHATFIYNAPSLGEVNELMNIEDITVYCRP